MKWSVLAERLLPGCLVVGLGLGQACAAQDCPAMVLPMLSLRLTDSATGEPLCGAHVRVYRAGAGPSMATDLDDGGCSYQQYSPVGLGRWTVEVERQGYFPLTFEYETTRRNDCGKIVTVQVSKPLQRDPSQPLETDAGLDE